MIFTRTNSGISNLPAFFNSDIVIYIEGGTSEENNETACSIDTVFWRSVFNKFASDTKVKFKPMGSKQNVLPIARKIVSGEVKNSIAAIDRDHDAYKNLIINHPKIIYSHGYSWENDAWRKGFIRSYAESLHPEGELLPIEHKIIEESYKNFEKGIFRLVLADVLCSKNGHQGIPREGTERFIKKAGNIYTIDSKMCRSVISKINKGKTSKIKNKIHTRPIPLSDCYGKIVGTFGYSVFKEVLTKVSTVKTLPKDVASQIIAVHFRNADSIKCEPEIHAYYAEKVAHALI
ncbi:DUF4435 domain-containing protein [Pseudomonas luteola]|uniref:DUF4435 domain-containing protein n=1 Tax=Pseudomonas luteola TaxID=47886 RepID=UPI000F7AF624|nr:DUF4435 domain-containing protein [Pseudomonas luteola]RRW45796.1 DUF4435 domain-containing protein [Pseudomonas luteola]